MFTNGRSVDAFCTRIVGSNVLFCFVVLFSVGEKWYIYGVGNTMGFVYTCVNAKYFTTLRLTPLVSVRHFDFCVTTTSTNKSYLKFDFVYSTNFLVNVFVCAFLWNLNRNLNFSTNLHIFQCENKLAFQEKQKSQLFFSENIRKVLNEHSHFIQYIQIHTTIKVISVTNCTLCEDCVYNTLYTVALYFTRKKNN